MHHNQSATYRQETELATRSTRELESLASSGDTVERLRLLCLSRGATGILALGRLLRIMDNDGDKNLNEEEFLRGLSEIGLEISHEEAKELFEKFDDGSGSINVDEFLAQIRPPLNGARRNTIDEVFRKMDKNGDGVISIDELRKLYDVRADPLYISGEESKNTISQRFLDNFENGATKEGQVTHEEFLNYYAGVSASIDNDCYFNLVMRQAYKL